MYKSADMDVWTGRIDSDGEKKSRRWHQSINPLAEGAEKPGIALLGICCDEGVRRNQGRPGAAEGPDIIRRSLANLACHLDRSLYDAGNLWCEQEQLEQLQHEQAVRVRDLLNRGHFPLLLGGGHEIAFGSYVGLDLHHSGSNGREEIGIINFDSHFDLRKADKPNSGTPFLQIADYCRETKTPFHYFCLGLNEASNTRSLFERADELGVEYLRDEEIPSWKLADTEKKLASFIQRNGTIYLSLDLDILPASTAPGVSAPASRGICLEVVEHLLNFIKSEAGDRFKIADITEYNPLFDIDGRTARVAARLCHLLAR